MPTTNYEGLGFSSESINSILKSNLVYNRQDLSWYEKFNRFGFLDPYNNLSQSREYLFFTKPDCHIFSPGTDSLQPALQNNTFFIDTVNRYPHVLQQLQSSCGSSSTVSQRNNITRNPFMVLLSNSVKNTIDLQPLTAVEMDGPQNMYGTSISYRKDAWGGDENVEFSLEFEDSKYLEVYMLARAYEEYERYKTTGLIYPPNIEKVNEVGEARHNCNKYISNKELHDVFGIYRIIVGEDFETIIYWAYICGAYMNSVPRDAFNDLKNGEGLRFTIDFKAFCVIDMDPLILANFNKLITNAYGNEAAFATRIFTYGRETELSLQNLQKETNASINGDWARYPMIAKVNNSSVPYSVWNASTSADMQYQYKLHWFA